MQKASADTVLDCLRWRYATKRFDSTKKIPLDTWSVLEEALRLAPSSFGLQPWKFLVVRDEEIRARLVPVSWNPKQVVDASHLVVFTVKDPLSVEDVRKHMERSAMVRGVPMETLEGFAKVVESFITAPPYPIDLGEWASRQVYIALGIFMQSAALLGIDTCPMEGIDPAAYDQILGLQGSGYRTLAACPAGYRHSEDIYASTPKVRYPKEQILEYK
jgi:nitroreductase